jgi:hypothetical protein
MGTKLPVPNGRDGEFWILCVVMSDIRDVEYKKPRLVCQVHRW